jgi:hypothetical protein
MKLAVFEQQLKLVCVHMCGGVAEYVEQVLQIDLFFKVAKPF